MRQSQLVLSNAAVMWTARVLLLVPQVVLVPYLIRTIGDEGYGVYALIWSLMASVDLVQNSLQSGVVKYSAAFLATHDTEAVNRVVSSSFVYSTLLGIAACACSCLGAAFYTDPTGKVASALVVVGLTILFTIPLTPFVAVIQSRQRYYVGAMADTVSKYAGLLAVFAWFRLVTPSVEAPIVIMAVMLFLSRLSQVPVAYRLVPGLRNRPRLFSWQSFRLITSFGLGVILLAFCLVINSAGVRWMMGTMVSPAFVAHLAIILMPVVLLTQIVEAVTITVMPATSAYEASGNQALLRELLARGTRYTTIIVMAGLLTAGLLMKIVLGLWVGPDYIFLAPYAMTLLASVSFMLSTSTAHHMLKGLGKVWSVFLIYAIGLAFVPIASMLAIYAFSRDPYLATAAGLALGHVVCGILQLRAGSHVVRIPVRELLRRGYLQPLAAGAAIGLLAFGAVFLIHIDSIPGRMGIAAAAEGALATVIYALVATPAERLQFKETLVLVWRKAVRA